MERGGGGGAARGNTANALEVSGMEFGGGGGGDGDYGSLFLLEGPKQVGASGATPLQLTTYGGGGGGGGVSSVWASGQSSIVGGPARARIPLVLEETPRGPTPTASERGRGGRDGGGGGGGGEYYGGGGESGSTTALITATDAEATTVKASTYENEAPPLSVDSGGTIVVRRPKGEVCVVQHQHQPEQRSSRVSQLHTSPPHTLLPPHTPPLPASPLLTPGALRIPQHAHHTLVRLCNNRECLRRSPEERSGGLGGGGGLHGHRS